MKLKFKLHSRIKDSTGPWQVLRRISGQQIHKTLTFGSAVVIVL